MRFGFLLVVVGGAACAAPAEHAAGAAACPEDDVLDGETCVPAACGVGTWGGIEADAYVLAGQDGDGTAERPFGSIQDAADSVGAGTVAIGAGVYVENVTFSKDHDGLSLRGRCAEMVTVDASSREEPAVMLDGKLGTNAAVSGFTTTGGKFGVGTIGGALSITDVVVADAGMLGVFAQTYGSNLVLDRVTVSGTAADNHGDFGLALYVTDGAVATMSNSVLTDAADAGIWVHNGVVTATASDIRNMHGVSAYTEGDKTVVSLTDMVIDTTAVNEGDGLAIGVDAVLGAHIDMADCAISGAAQHGVFVGSAGTIVASDTTVSGSGGAAVLVRDEGSELTWTGGSIRESAGMGMQIQGGPTVDLSDMSISDSTQFGVYAIGSETNVVMEDVDVSDTHVGDENAASGVYIVDHAALTATRLISRDNAMTGVVVDAATATLDDVRVLENGGSDPGLEYGLYIDNGGVVDVHGGLFDANIGVAIQAAGPGSLLRISHVTVTRTQLDANGAYGTAVMVGDGASAELDACTLAENAQFGVQAVDSTVVMADSEVTGNGNVGLMVGSETGDPVDAVVEVLRGVISYNGAFAAQVFDANLFITDADVDGNRSVGIIAGGDAGYLELDGVTIADVLPLDRDDGDAHGISVQEGAEAWIRNSSIERSVGIGVLVDAATANLEHVRIEDVLRSPAATVGIGVNVQVDGVVAATDLDVGGTAGPGVLVTGDALFACDSCSIHGNTFAGVVAWTGVADLLNTTIADNGADANNGGGIGIFADGTERGTAVLLSGSTIGAHPYAGIWVTGGGSYDIDSTAFSGGEGVTLNGWPAHGNGVFAGPGVSGWDDAEQSGLRLTNNAFGDAANDAVLLHGAAAELDGNSWSENATDVRQQHCTAVPALSQDDLVGVPTTEICLGGDVLIDTSVTFALYLAEPKPTR